MVGIIEMRAKLRRMHEDIRAPSTGDDYLFDALPSLAEWQGATSAKLGRRGKKNQELLHIDAELIRFRQVAKGVRASAILRIDALVKQWFQRRGAAAPGSRRYAPMDVMRQIVDALRQHVVYDRNAWLQRHSGTPGPQDIIPGGFTDTGRTFVDFRRALLSELSGVGAETRHNDSMNEADRRILGTFGLRSGAEYHGGAACFNAASWAEQNIRGTFVSLKHPTCHFTIVDLSVERNSNDTHHYAIDANGVIVDPTWRQFFQSARLTDTPAIFVGTIEDMSELVSMIGDQVGRLNRIYNGTKATAYQVAHGVVL